MSKIAGTWDVRAAQALRDMASGLDEIQTFIENSRWLHGDEDDPMLERAIRSIAYHKAILNTVSVEGPGKTGAGEETGQPPRVSGLTPQAPSLSPRTQRDQAVANLEAPGLPEPTRPDPREPETLGRRPSTNTGPHCHDPNCPHVIARDTLASLSPPSTNEEGDA